MGNLTVKKRISVPWLPSCAAGGGSPQHTQHPRRRWATSQASGSEPRAQPAPGHVHRSNPPVACAKLDALYYPVSLAKGSDDEKIGHRVHEEFLTVVVCEGRRSSRTRDGGTFSCDYATGESGLTCHRWHCLPPPPTIMGGNPRTCGERFYYKTS